MRGDVQLLEAPLLAVGAWQHPTDGMVSCKERLGCSEPAHPTRAFLKPHACIMHRSLHAMWSVWPGHLGSRRAMTPGGSTCTGARSQPRTLPRRCPVPSNILLRYTHRPGPLTPPARRCRHLPVIRSNATSDASRTLWWRPGLTTGQPSSCMERRPY